MNDVEADEQELREQTAARVVVEFRRHQAAEDQRSAARVAREDACLAAADAGWQMKEIAEWVGVSPQRISTMVANAEERRGADGDDT